MKAPTNDGPFGDEELMLTAYVRYGACDCIKCSLERLAFIDVVKWILALCKNNSNGPQSVAEIERIMQK